MDKQKTAYLFAITAILFWSTVATAFKFALRYFDFIQFLFYSSVVALIVLLIIIIIQKKIRQIFSFTLKQYLFSAFLGLLNPTLYYLILFKAYSVLPAQLAQALNYTWPIMLVILSIPLLGQKLTMKSTIAILISFSGVVLISMKGKFFDFTGANIQGILLAVSTSVVWALYWILNVKDKRDETVKLFLNFVAGVLFLLPLIIIYSEIKIDINIKLLPVIYSGIFEMGLTFVFWLKAMKLTSSNDKISNLVFISPFVSLIFIRIFLDENIYITTIFGLVLIIAGIITQKIKLKNYQT